MKNKKLYTYFTFGAPDANGEVIPSIPYVVEATSLQDARRVIREQLALLGLDADELQFMVKEGDNRKEIEAVYRLLGAIEE